MKTIFCLLLLLLLFPVAMADEPMVIDLEELNARIGLDYEDLVTWEDLVEEALGTPLLLYGEVHNQEGAVRHFLTLVEGMRVRSQVPLRIGVEFVDRGDDDILHAYLKGSLDEASFLERLMPTSFLLSPEMGSSHLQLLRYARAHDIDVLTLESRPSGARPRTLRNSEIRWNLAQHLGHHPDERLVVLYGVDHIFGVDPIAEGLEIPHTSVSSYGDSVHAAFVRHEGRRMKPGEIVRLREGTFLQSGNGPLGPRGLIRLWLDAREDLLAAIESIYGGSRENLEEVVEALLDPEVRWRRAAFHALRFAAQDDLGYDPEAPEAARRDSQLRWLSWARGTRPTRFESP